MKNKEKILKLRKERTALVKGELDLNDPVTRKIVQDNQNKVVPELIKHTGICIECGKSISEDRLKIITTNRCIDCQNSYEALL